MASRRLRKKRHKHALGFDIVDLSWNPHWRRRLFDAEMWEELAIDAHAPQLPAHVRRALVRHRLRFVVQKVPAEERRELWLEPTFVIFRFRAREFPEVWLESANNPAV